MKKLILIRYGSWADNRLTQSGKQEMISAATRLRTVIQNSKTAVVAGDVPRATESAKIIAGLLQCPYAGSYNQLYAAEEEGKLPDPQQALATIRSIGKEYDTVAAVVSREYIEALPQYIAQTLFSSNVEPTSLDRGEALIIDFQSHDLKYLRSA